MGLAKTSKEIRPDRKKHQEFLHTNIIALPSPKYEQNLGVLVRTADATGMCLALPLGDAFMLRKSNTIGHGKVCVHDMLPTPMAWLQEMRSNFYVIAVELAHHAIKLSDLPPLADQGLIVLGNEASGISEDILEMADCVVEIPMQGVGNSLNVAVAGSLVAYKWKGWT